MEVLIVVGHNPTGSQLPIANYLYWTCPIGCQFHSKLPNRNLTMALGNIAEHVIAQFYILATALSLQCSSVLFLIRKFYNGLSRQPPKILIYRSVLPSFLQIQAVSTSDGRADDNLRVWTLQVVDVRISLAKQWTSSFPC